MDASIALPKLARRSVLIRPRVADSTSRDVDRTLLIRVQQRDVRALEMLYDSYASRALGLAFHILKDRDLAEQVIQDAFWRVWRNADKYEPARGSFSTWLFTIVHNLAIDQLRRRREELPLEDAEQGEVIESELPDVSDLATRQLRSDEIRAAVNKLPEAQRRVIELAYFEGLSRPEIAQQLSTPLGTIHTRARLGLEKLRRLLNA